MLAWLLSETVELSLYSVGAVFSLGRWLIFGRTEDQVQRQLRLLTEQVAELNREIHEMRAIKLDSNRE
jgi:hypothetical protein